MGGKVGRLVGKAPTSHHQDRPCRRRCPRGRTRHRRSWNPRCGGHARSHGGGMAGRESIFLVRKGGRRVCCRTREPESNLHDSSNSRAVRTALVAIVLLVVVAAAATASALGGHERLLGLHEGEGGSGSLWPTAHGAHEAKRARPDGLPGNLRPVGGRESVPTNLPEGSPCRGGRGSPQDESSPTKAKHGSGRGGGRGIGACVEEFGGPRNAREPRGRPGRLPHATQRCRLSIPRNDSC